jgi:DNA-binding MarR family transcriptional regulator
MAAWIALVRGHSALVRELNAQLLAQHGLTISDYEVLLRLANAPERSMRRVDLAESVLLTPSGITRLLDGLERCGHVERGSCDTDRRVTYAVLTDQGQEKFTEARESHLADVRELFTGRFSDDELGTLAELLGRLSADGGDECGTEQE